jgi:ribA/ribD-fused uncharacterized protein
MPNPQEVSSSRIYFYGPEDNNGWLSTFSEHPILIDASRWPTVEHFFQAQKFDDLELRETIRLSESPAEAKRLGRFFKAERRLEWEQVKEDVMMRALRAKFEQHPVLAAKLIETNDIELLEDSPDDFYWGIGSNGRGLNRLGHLLMKVRSELQERQ